jgi:plastocyanin
MTKLEVHVLKLLILPAALLVLAFGLVGCSSSDDDDDNSPASAGTARSDGPTSGTTPSSSGSGSGSVQDVAVRAGERGEQYFFEVSNTNLKAGKVKVTLTNAGPERNHTFVVKKLDNSGNLAEIDEVQPNLTGTAEFDLTAGTYQFQCDLRGHADRGQKGSFTVSN